LNAAKNLADESLTPYIIWFKQCAGLSFSERG
jgi:hypothetical protein